MIQKILALTVFNNYPINNDMETVQNPKPYSGPFSNIIQT